jgi:hypothetical protein
MPNVFVHFFIRAKSNADSGKPSSTPHFAWNQTRFCNWRGEEKQPKKKKRKSKGDAAPREKEKKKKSEKWKRGEKSKETHPWWFLCECCKLITSILSPRAFSRAPQIVHPLDPETLLSEAKEIHFFVFFFLRFFFCSAPSSRSCWNEEEGTFPHKQKEKEESEIEVYHGLASSAHNEIKKRNQFCTLTRTSWLNLSFFPTKKLKKVK